MVHFNNNGPQLLFRHSRLPPGRSTDAAARPGGAAGPELRRRAPVPPGLRARVHGVPRHGRVRAAVVRGDAEGPDGVPHQEAARRGGHAVRQGPHLPAGEVHGQDPQEAVLGKARRTDGDGGWIDGWMDGWKKKTGVLER